MPFDDFPGTRIDNTCTIGPATGRAMHPLNDVVAQIHRIGTLGQELNPKSVPVAGRFEGLIPPVGTLKKRGTNRLGRSAVEAVDDGLHRFATAAPGSFF